MSMLFGARQAPDPKPRESTRGLWRPHTLADQGNNHGNWSFNVSIFAANQAVRIRDDHLQRFTPLHMTVMCALRPLSPML
jgi:hypothetical protein